MPTIKVYKIGDPIEQPHPATWAKKIVTTPGGVKLYIL